MSVLSLIKFEPVIKCEKEAEDCHTKSLRRTSTNQILCESNGSTSVTVGVVHIKVEQEDDKEYVHYTEVNTEPQNENNLCSLDKDTNMECSLRDDTINETSHLHHEKCLQTNVVNEKSSNRELNEDKQLACEVSSAQFNTKQLLSEHMRRNLCVKSLQGDTITVNNKPVKQQNHTGRIPYKCSIW